MRRSRKGSESSIGERGQHARLFDDVSLESVPIEVIDGQSLCRSGPAPLLAGAAGSREWQMSFETAEGRADASSPPVVGALGLQCTTSGMTWRLATP
jgi:hypothetical protein